MKTIKIRIPKNKEDLRKLPIIPNELVKKYHIYENNSIMFEDDIKQSRFRYTGCYQDLNEEIVKKCSNLSYLFTKNIILKKLNTILYLEDIVQLIYNPNRKKFLNFILETKKSFRRKEQDKITKALLDKPLPENFNILDHVKYNKKENIIEYSTFLFNLLYKLKHLHLELNINYLIPDKISVKYLPSEFLEVYHIFINGGREELKKREYNYIPQRINFVVPTGYNPFKNKIIATYDSVNLSKIINRGCRISDINYLNNEIKGNKLEYRKDSAYKLNFIPTIVKFPIDMLTNFFQEEPEIFTNSNSTEVHLYFRKRKLFCRLKVGKHTHYIKYDKNTIHYYDDIF